MFIQIVSTTGAAVSLCIIGCLVFVIAFHAKLKKREREMTDPSYFHDPR